MNLDKFLQELDLKNPPDERTCKQIYGFEIGNPGIAEKVMRMYEEAGLWYIRTLYGAYLEDQQAKEQKTALEVSEWYHEELKKRKEYKERFIKEKMEELINRRTQNGS